MKDEALEYHSKPKPGKTEVVPTKPTNTKEDLSLAYSPGVAYPCLEIKENPDDAYLYTNKANLVGVISNGTAVLGLQNIGALASKPVMEGKGVLFKKFANVDVFDIEIAEEDPDKFIEIVTALSPTFGGINLEDIKAPECFYIEDEIKKRTNIPIFHDDQHGTAIVAVAGLWNALKKRDKQIESIKIVINGAGAAANAIAHLIIHLGAKKENIYMFDSKGLITESDNKYKAFFAQSESQTLAECLVGADVFIGVSVGNLLTKEMVQSMNQPIIFALANPTPEIMPELAKEADPDVIIATGRSDYPNQINNVLCFPFVFRGALDTLASEINLDMKIAAAKAIAALAEERIIPKPFDSRLLWTVAPAVAQAAMDTGVARKKIDIEEYKKHLRYVR